MITTTSWNFGEIYLILFKFRVKPFFPISFPIQLLQHQHRWKCLTWDLCVHTCVNTHKIKNSFRASIPVGEMAKAGILLVIIWLLVQCRIWLESSPEWAHALATERTGNDLLTMTVRRWCACGSPLLHSLCRPPVDTGLQHTRVQIFLCAIWTKAANDKSKHSSNLHESHTHTQNVAIPADLMDTSHLPGNCTCPAFH